MPSNTQQNNIPALPLPMLYARKIRNDVTKFVTEYYPGRERRSMVSHVSFNLATTMACWPNTPSKRATMSVLDSEFRRSKRWQYDTYREHAYPIRGESFTVLQNNSANGDLISAHPRIDLVQEIAPRSSAPYLIGFELEIEIPSSRDGSSFSKILQQDLPGEVYTCSDGSLSNGLEIVHAPRTPKEYRDKYTTFYKTFKRLVKIGGKSHDTTTCGLHFHVSRKAMPEEKWIKLAKFIAQNAGIFTKLSRREERQLSQYAAFSLNRGSRYHAINFTNTDTIEFRFFRGTLLPKSFYGALEIVQSLVDFQSKSAKNITLKRWITHLKSNSKYKYGAIYLAEKLEGLDLGVTRRQYSAAEREERRCMREAARNRRQTIIEREIADIITRAQNQIQTGLNYYMDVTQPIYRIRMPIEFSGPQRLMRPFGTQRYMDLIVPHCRFNGNSSTFGIVKIRRSTGWGNTRTNSHVSFSSYSPPHIVLSRYELIERPIVSGVVAPTTLPDECIF